MKIASGVRAGILSVLGDWPGARRLGANAAWLMGDRLMRLAVGLVVGVWMARSLGPSLFGTYSFAVAALILAMPLATLGLEALVVRELIAGAPRDETLGTVFVLRLGAGLLAGVLAIGTVFLARRGDRVVVALVSLVSCQLAFQAFDVIDLWCQSQLLSRLTVLAKGVAFLCASGLRVFLLIQGAGVVAFGWAAAIEMGLGALLLTAVFLRRGGRFQFRVSRARAGELLRQSWPFLLSGVAIIVYMRIDQFMLGLIIGDGAVGIYSAAARISELWYFVPTAIVISASPVILEARYHDEALYLRRLQHLFNSMAGLAYVIAVPVVLFARPITALVFGPAYSAAAPVLAVHVWGAVFVFLGVARETWVVAEGVARIALATTVSGAFANIALNLVLIPRWGPLGAAVATVLSQAAVVYLIPLVMPDARFRRVGLMMTKALTFGMVG
jgi:PST family polysaccharide transporter